MPVLKYYNEDIYKRWIHNKVEKYAYLSIIGGGLIFLVVGIIVYKWKDYNYKRLMDGKYYFSWSRFKSKFRRKKKNNIDFTKYPRNTPIVVPVDAHQRNAFEHDLIPLSALSEDIYRKEEKLRTSDIMEALNVGPPPGPPPGMQIEKF